MFVLTQVVPCYSFSLYVFVVSIINLSDVASIIVGLLMRLAKSIPTAYIHQMNALAVASGSILTGYILPINLHSITNDSEIMLSANLL